MPESVFQSDPFTCRENFGQSNDEATAFVMHSLPIIFNIVTRSYESLPVSAKA